MIADFDSKQAARQAIWDRLKEEKLARFPFPPHGRIPNFKGAKEAALRLFEEPEWRDAKYIKVNPDSPQKYVRAEALKRGIVVYVPTPRLKGGFMKLDPAKIPFDAIGDASQMSRCARWAEPVELRDMPQLDAIVTGCVAVTDGGRRAGKGEGYSDIEFAILRELGHDAVPVATTVNDVQVVGGFPIEANDLPLTVIATPARTIRVSDPPPPPSAIEWDRLSDQDLSEMPILRELKALTRKRKDR
ncbi:MAG: 5-formyltetrahydrofolate cyclo-ligase [Alphaproteobacteria bacterium]